MSVDIIARGLACSNKNILKGGTTNQVLTKDSGDDFDFSWKNITADESIVINTTDYSNFTSTTTFAQAWASKASLYKKVVVIAQFTQNDLIHYDTIIPSKIQAVAADVAGTNGYIQLNCGDITLTWNSTGIVLQQ